MKYQGRDATVYGRYFLINIAQPENLPASSLVAVKDPRRLRYKLAAYVGVVEEVGDTCFLVKPGDRVVIKRWEWQQQDVDDERLLAREDDLVVLDGGVPAPGIIIMRLITEEVKTSLIVPETIRARRPKCMQGEVLCHSQYRMGELKGKELVGRVLHFERSDDDQWMYGDKRIAIKVSRYFQIMAIEHKEELLHVI